MTSYKQVFVLVTVALTTLLMLVGCTTEVDYSLGAEFVPSSQNMELRRRVYELGTMTEGDRVEECGLTTTRLYKSDSLRSANIEYGYFGRETSDTFGMRSAGFMSQMIFSISLHKGRGWGYRPIFDSMMLSLYITDYHGDTTKKHRFEVYEITSNDYLNLPKDKDTTFYINFDPSPYISKEPIFTFEFPNQERGVYVGNVESPEEQKVLLEPTAATREYIERLMFLTDLEANGGYALDVDSLYVNGNERAFIDRFGGVYIAPADEPTEGNGAMFATKLENTALLLYSRDRYEEDPTIIRDTTYMVYNFYLNPNEYDIEAGNVSINTIDHDFSAITVYDSSALDFSLPDQQRSDVLVGCVDGMGGIVTEVTFTDDFIQSLADIALSAEDAVVSVNQARLSFYLEGSSYDYLDINSLYMAPIMDNAMERMGLYTDFDTLIGITDYPYTMESQTSLNYDGYINRSLANYTMDIANYVQSLMAAAAENVDADGRVIQERFREEYGAESLVNYRRFYVAPEAYSLYGFKRQTIIGTDGEVDGATNTAPIKLELIYTIVN